MERIKMQFEAKNDSEGLRRTIYGKIQQWAANREARLLRISHSDGVRWFGSVSSWIRKGKIVRITIEEIDVECPDLKNHVIEYIFPDGSRTIRRGDDPVWRYEPAKEGVA